MKNLLTSSLTLLGAVLCASETLAQNFDFIADYVRYDENAQWVTIEGQIEVLTEYGYFYPSHVEYDVANEKIYVDGRLNGVLPSGERFIADFAELDFKTQAGIMQQMRLMLADNVQIAASVASEDGTVSYVENVVMSTCTVCALNPTPVWQFAASQVYRDRDAEKIYIRNGRFEFYGIPLGWVPYLRIPDPSAKRMDGFLTPEIIASNTNITGIKLPYYIPISEQTDVTITPYFTAQNAQVVEGQIRHMGKGYKYEGRAIQALNDGTNDDSRYSVSNTFRFKLTPKIRGVAKYTFQSDYDLLEDFGYGNPSSNYIFIEQFDNQYWYHSEIIDYRPLSEASINRESPLVLPHIQGSYNYSHSSGLQFQLDGDFLYLNNDLSADVTRGVLSAEADYVGSLPPLLSYQAKLGAQANAYNVDNAKIASENGTASRFTPYGALDVQLPFTRSDQWGIHTLTPRFMMAWSENYEDGVPIPNNDSLFTEHDFVSLFSPNHYMGHDEFEEGFRASAGLNYGLMTQTGEYFDLGIGRLWQSDEFFSEDRGRYDDYKDWVGYLNYQFDDNWSLFSRWAFDQNLDFTRTELEVKYDSPRSFYSLEWVRIGPEPVLGFEEARSELLGDGRYQFAPNFEVDYNLRYDLVNLEMFDAGLALTYGNECMEIQAGVAWDFPLTTGNETETSYSISVDLLGITKENKGKWASRTCHY